MTDIGSKLDTISINLTAISKEQSANREENERHRKNTVLIKRVLNSDGIKQHLTAQLIRDVSAIDVEPVERVDKTSIKKQVTHTAASGGLPAVILKPKVVPKTPKVTPIVESKKVPQHGEDGDPPAKKQKKKKFALDSDEDSSEEEPESEQRVEVEFGYPQPDRRLVLAGTNSKGRRVYGIKGTKDPKVLAGCFLLYKLDGKKTVYQFEDASVKKATAAMVKKFNIKAMAQLPQTAALFVEAGVFFAQMLIEKETTECPSPIFLDRPIISMAGQDLKSVFNELPEPVRSTFYKFCKDCGCFSDTSKENMDKVALLLDEMAQTIEPDIAKLRLDYQAVSVEEDFDHAPFA